MNYKDIEQLGDDNITAALHWSQDLGQSASIPQSLQNSTSRASFINEFNNKHGARIATVYFSQEIGERKSFLKEIAEYSKKELNDLVGTDEQISGLVFKLWASCILVSKYIDPRRSKPKEERENVFTTVLDQFAKNDLIFRIGMQTSISFCELRKEDYILDGVPADSYIRK